MAKLEDVRTWHGRDLVGAGGERIGTIEDVYYDEKTGEPEWVTVKPGLLGGLHFVPLESAQLEHGTIAVPFDKDVVRHSPSVGTDDELTPVDERELYAYYGRQHPDLLDEVDAAAPIAGAPGAGEPADPLDPAPLADPGAPPPTAPGADAAMTRSEEELRIDKRRRAVGRARLRKYIVTEHVHLTVPVRREEVRLEREPITDADLDEAAVGPELSESEHEVTLYAEEPVISKRVVPKERVRLSKDVHTEERVIDDDVRKERIEAEGEGLV